MIALNAQGPGSAHTRQQAVPESPPSQIVSRPVPQSQSQDPRTYQLGQLRKRFSPKETEKEDGTTSLDFKLIPSDPDFPFELSRLHCEINVPGNFPKEGPQLRVLNTDIPRGFSINVERGWDRLVAERKGATLLSLVHALDKNLERFLSEQKVETVKLVGTFKDTRHIAQEPSKTPSASSQPGNEKVSAATAAVYKPYIPELTYTREEMIGAKARRTQEIRQLEARMGRLPLYRRSADGVVYTLPIEPKRRTELPPSLASVNNIHLIVPLLYPLQDLRVQLNEAAAEDAEPIEDLFVEKANEQKQMSLMSHVNYLVQNLHVLAKQASRKSNFDAKKGPDPAVEGSLDTTPAAAKGQEKSHIQVIPRPPEWNVGGYGEDSESEDTSGSDSDNTQGGGASLHEHNHDAAKDVVTHDTPERGTMISFPSVELYGIELLQVSLLSISVKCERCKTANDITGLKPGVNKATSCKKCGTSLTATFNQQLVHQHSSRAGFLDLSGCTVADMLPSTFVPTCGKCSTAGLGLVSVRGDSTTNICRECHGKFTFKIPQVKFLFITPGTRAPPTSGPRRKLEKLGLHAGEQLPNKGACAHYRKSYRWFRFSCCSKVHPCDRCHDEAEDHINEWANRMICGWCSREQNYAVEVCGFCGRGVIGRKGRGFWEGGKGTRDQNMMSKKDPRKYKRIGHVPAS